MTGAHEIMSRGADRPEITAEPPGAEISVERVTELAGPAVHELCDAADSAILDGGKYGKLTGRLTPEKALKSVERFWPMDPNVFARKVLRQVARNRAIIIEPASWKLSWWLSRLSPPVGIYLSRRMFESSRKELGL